MRDGYIVKLFDGYKAGLFLFIVTDSVLNWYILLTCLLIQAIFAAH
jgi:hypothetical protein